MRYGDSPLFLDVASITNSYSLQTQVNVNANWFGGVVGLGAHDSLGVGATGVYSDKPTITYNPLNGQRFTRSMMTPVPPGVVVSLIQSGWAADAVLRIMVTSLNGVQNRFGAGVRARGADPEFYRLGKAMRTIQASGAVGMRVEKTKDQEWAVLAKEAKLDKATEQAQRDVREILDLQPGNNEARVVYGSAPKGDNEIAMLTRSLLEILTDLAASIEVPASDAAEGRTYATKVFESDGPGGFRPLIRILSGPDRPKDAFAAIAYRNHWFWVDDRDYVSKQVFSYLLILMSLTDTDPGKGAPIITIPAG
jgi:hypothetical protein